MLLVFFAYLILLMLQKLKIKISLNFLLALLPYIVFGGVLRALTDGLIVPRSFWTVTPGIFFLIMGITIAVLLTSLKLEKMKKIPYWKSMSITGLIILIPFIIQIRIFNLTGLLLFLGYFSLSTIPFIILSKYSKVLKDKLNLLMIIAHMVDASATHVSMQFFGYYEQHVFPTFFINLFGSSLGMFPLKFLVLIPVIYALNKMDDQEVSNYIKIVFILFGLAPGLRGFLRLIMGV